MNCVVYDGVCLNGGWLSVGAPSMHSMFGLSLARHVHWSSHRETMLSCGLEFWWPALTSVWYLVCLFD